MMDDNAQRCLTDGSEDVNDVVADVTLRGDRPDPDLSGRDDINGDFFLARRNLGCHFGQNNLLFSIFS